MGESKGQGATGLRAIFLENIERPWRLNLAYCRGATRVTPGLLKEDCKCLAQLFWELLDLLEAHLKGKRDCCNPK